jgi:hypothetical protein
MLAIFEVFVIWLTASWKHRLRGWLNHSIGAKATQRIFQRWLHVWLAFPAQVEASQGSAKSLRQCLRREVIAKCFLVRALRIRGNRLQAHFSVAKSFSLPIRSPTFHTLLPMTSDWDGIVVSLEMRNGPSIFANYL